MEGFFASKRQLEPSSADRFDSNAGGGSTHSSRRRHSSSAATSFKHPSPPLKLSPTETLFRILCPSDKTGGVIGKGGSIIRQFREETGAKIRIDDPVPGSDDRVILIIADAHVKKREDTSGGDGEGDNVSPAQRTLVRVFERILRVDEEWSLEAEGGAGEEKEIQGPVVCRLLAPSSHVGCVLGKGGKIVEKLRQESGAHIRVLSKEQVPVCAAAGDELIHINGSFSAVRKALLSVSSRLQDNSKMDAANFTNTKLFGAPGSGSLVQVDRFPQRGYVAGFHAPESQSRVYSSNDNTTSGYKKVIEEEVLFRMLCSNEKVGSIIGKGGVIVRALQSETGALIKVVDAMPDSEERVVVISARENSDLKHSPTQEAVLRVHSRLMDAGVEKGSAACARLLVPLQQIGCLLGKGGNIISEMRKLTGASIRIFLKEHVPRCAQPNDEVVQVTGSFQSVQDALLHITGRIRETILPAKPHSSIGTPQYKSTQHDIPPALFRSRNEPTSPGCYSSTGISHGFGRSSGLSPATDRQNPLSQSVDCRGLATADRVPYSYANETSGLCSTFDCSSPRSWVGQTVNSGNHRSITDSGTGLGFRSGMGGSGSLSSVATITTVEVVVPHHFMGFVFGENCNNLSQIREVSGAEVTIPDLKPGATEGTVIISGTSDQTRAAQSLLHAFILCGKMKT